jgi:polysaccharide pyruvyl transferase WcaK-like protein
VLTKAFAHLEGFAVSQHAEGCSRELVRERLHAALLAQAGRSAIKQRTDIRMSLAANEAERAGDDYRGRDRLRRVRSVAAFRRVFTDKMGMTPGHRRRIAREGE